MRIAIVSETSAADKNGDILAALQNCGHLLINAGMGESCVKHELTYIETGLMAAILLNTGRVDFVIGGCGTGQGFLNSVMQYPNVFCGLIREPIDAWLFSMINGGNCISLALNRGYGWAGDINLKFILEKLFSSKAGSGYPEHRRESQQQSRDMLKNISSIVHLKFTEIITKIDIGILGKVLSFPGFSEILDIETLKDIELRNLLTKKFDEIAMHG